MPIPSHCLVDLVTPFTRLYDTFSHGCLGHCALCDPFGDITVTVDILGWLVDLFGYCHITAHAHHTRLFPRHALVGWFLVGSLRLLLFPLPRLHTTLPRLPQLDLRTRCVWCHVDVAHTPVATRYTRYCTVTYVAFTLLRLRYRSHALFVCCYGVGLEFSLLPVLCAWTSSGLLPAWFQYVVRFPTYLTVPGTVQFYGLRIHCLRFWNVR